MQYTQLERANKIVKEKLSLETEISKLLNNSDISFKDSSSKGSRIARALEYLSDDTLNYFIKDNVLIRLKDRLEKINKEFEEI